MVYPKSTKAISLAWTGASGAPYGLKLLECLLASGFQVFLMISSAARVVLATEHGLQLSANSEKAKQQLLAVLAEKNAAIVGELVVLGKDEWFSPPHQAAPHLNKWSFVLARQEHSRRLRQE